LSVREVPPFSASYPFGFKSGLAARNAAFSAAESTLPGFSRFTFGVGRAKGSGGRAACGR